MAPDEPTQHPPRPRRDRPLVAPGRERPTQAAAPPPPPPPPPSAGPPLTGDLPPGTRADRVIVWFEAPPETQRRVSVAFRFFLAFPHYCRLIFSLIAASFAVFFGWWAALFTGHLPAGIARYAGNVVQYGTRVQAYGLYLLTDVKPPWSLSAPDYAVSVETNPGQLNRFAVLFRIVLMIPAQLVAGLAGGGAYLVGTVNWLITLIAGAQPKPLFEAYAALLRFQARFYAFTWMLTAEQPSGLYGDKPAPTGSLTYAPDADPASLPSSPRFSRLVLSSGAKLLLTLFIVAGVLSNVGSSFSGSFTAIRSASALAELEIEHDELQEALRDYSGTMATCPESSASCQSDANATLARAFEEFRDDVADIEFPPSIDASPLLADADAAAEALRKMETATSSEEYDNYAREVSEAVDELDADYAEISPYG